MTRADRPSRPSHYTQGAIECIDAMRSMMTPDEFESFCRGNVIKYLWRMNDKDDPLVDARKARDYLNWLIKSLETTQ